MSRPPPDPIFTLRHHTGEVTSLSFVDELSDYPHLLSGSTTGEVFLWNLKTYRVDNKLEAHKKKHILWVESLGNNIFTQGRDGLVNIWNYDDNDKWKISRSIPAPTAGFCQCDISKLKNLIAVPGEKACQIDLYDFEKCSLVSTLIPESSDKYGMCICVKWLKPGNYILCGYENGKIILWDINQAAVLSELTCHKEPVFGLDFDDSVKWEGITCSAEEKLCVFSMKNFLSLVEKNCIVLPTTGASSVAVRQDGKIVASGGWDGIIRLFSWKTLKPLAYLNFHKSAINCLKFYAGKSENYAKLLAAGSKDKRITLWSIYRDK
ncbi:guanine nucleotide-binding protein subunit beta-like protein 1 isoform X1 [Centruroides vittatus]|uniref:guanine nucleotide-binding protein subunit beta-like protein 1 isoform X1 n=1 Tax=Centruroides vittatus TaxID=120091 RepID=UPI00350F3F5C